MDTRGERSSPYLDILGESLSKSLNEEDLSVAQLVAKEEKKLSKQAKNSDVNMFAQNIFPKIFEKIAQACYVEQMDAFAKLFEDPSFYGRVMEEMGRAMYFNLKNGQ